MTDYSTERNKVINKYVGLTSRHLNWIKLDGNSNEDHDQKVVDICVKIKHDKDYGDFLCRPIVQHVIITCLKCGEIKEFGKQEFAKYQYIKSHPCFEYSHKSKFLKMEEFTNIPDIMPFQKEPFLTKVIEVIDSEERSHADSKNYPSEFKVVNVGVDDCLEWLI